MTDEMNISENEESKKRKSIGMLQVVIGGNETLVHSSQIREVVRPLPLTWVPVGPDHILGLANIHGQIVSIIDAGKISSLPSVDGGSSARTRFLVLRHPVMHVGVWVDEVKRLRNVESEALNRARAGSDDVVYSLEIDGFMFDVLDCSKLFH